MGILYGIVIICTVVALVVAPGLWWAWLLCGGYGLAVVAGVEEEWVMHAHKAALNKAHKARKAR
jgi:hypothetical protein